MRWFGLVWFDFCHDLPCENVCSTTKVLCVCRVVFSLLGVKGGGVQILIGCVPCLGCFQDQIFDEKFKAVFDAKIEKKLLYDTAKFCFVFLRITMFLRCPRTYSHEIRKRGASTIFLSISRHPCFVRHKARNHSLVEAKATPLPEY